MSEETPVGVMSYFPLEAPRKSQEIVILEIDRVFKGGTKIVVLEAPVGSGKSAIAMTLALQAVGQAPIKGSAHVITPRKSLQDQYFEDFSEEVVLMKGRNSYPCIYDQTPRQYLHILKAVAQGKSPSPASYSDSCASSPCLNSSTVYKYCTQDKDCPYTLAMETAQSSPIVVHNIHSFIYQTKFSEKFDERDLLVVDEAHEIENTVREFLTVKLTVDLPIGFDQEPPQENTATAWQNFLLQEPLLPVETERERRAKELSEAYVTKRDEYFSRVTSIVANGLFEKNFSVEKATRPLVNGKTALDLQFVPHSLGQAPRNLLFNYGKRVLLMSGTIYNKDQYCATLGLSQDEVHFMRVGSSFPAENRPIIIKPKYLVNTSHARWHENLPQIAENIRSILEVFHDVKGLIHAPSYAAGQQLLNEIADPRIWTHKPENFLTELEKFFESKGNGVFLSPVCQQGVDFKEDRARFQIIVRVPYPSINSDFVSHKVEKDFAWYNYQALVTFGQQLGRVNRSEKDFGVTFLLDDRFARFISRNNSYLPGWVKEAFVWK